MAQEGQLFEEEPKGDVFVFPVGPISYDKSIRENSSVCVREVFKNYVFKLYCNPVPPVETSFRLSI